MRFSSKAIAIALGIGGVLVGIYFGIIQNIDPELKVVISRPVVLFSKNNVEEGVLAYDKKTESVIRDDVNMLFVKYWGTKKGIASQDVQAPLKICFGETAQILSAELVAQNERHSVVNKLLVTREDNCFVNRWNVLLTKGDGATVKVIYKGVIIPEISVIGGILDCEIDEISYATHKLKEEKINFDFSPYKKYKGWCAIICFILLILLLLQMMFSSLIKFKDEKTREKIWTQIYLVEGILFLVCMLLVAPSWADHVFAFFDPGGIPNF